MAGQVTSMPFRMGDAFRKNDVLVAFDCERAEAQHAKARAELDRAETTLASRKALVALEASSNLDVALAESEVKYARAGVQETGAVMKYCQVKAPYAGRVVNVSANQFEFVGPGEPLIEIIETGALQIEVIVPSHWLRWIEAGHVFSVQVDELGTSVAAEVLSVGARVDPVSQTIALRAALTSAQDGLRPGMSGSAVFEVPAQ